MGMLNTLRRWFGAEDTPARFVEAVSTDVDDEDGWRALTGDDSRDLSPLTQDRMQAMVHFLWERNPGANRMIELPIAFLIAEGVALKAENDDAQQVLDDFWADPINAMDMNLDTFVRELAMYGEQCWPVFVNEIDGAVRLGYLDPRLIDKVVMDPDNPRMPVGIVTKKDAKGRYKKYRVIVAGPESVFTQRTQAARAGFTDGECFYFRVNHTGAGKRGRSDLLHVADWADAYEQYLFGEMERFDHLRAFVWDVTLTGADDAGIKKFARENPPPKPGSQRVHNDSVKYEAVSPSLNAVDGAEGARMFRNHVLSGGSIPEHWFGGGGDVNRAVGAEMGEPVFKIMSLRQRKWKHILEAVGRYVLWRHYSAGHDTDYADERLQCEAIFPELTARDTTKYAAAMQQVVAGAVVAVAEGLLTRETAVGLIAAIAGRLGVEFDAAEELKAAMEEHADAEAKRREDDAFTGPDPDAAESNAIADAANANALQNAAAAGAAQAGGAK